MTRSAASGRVSQRPCSTAQLRNVRTLTELVDVDLAIGRADGRASPVLAVPGEPVEPAWALAGLVDADDGRDDRNLRVK